MPARYGHPVELRHLRYFIGVSDASSFSAAARLLRVAQPALSRQIRMLEEEIGVPLFHRDRSGVRLTQPGEAFLKEARAILERSENAIRAAQSGTQPFPAELNVGYVWGLFHSSVPSWLARFRSAHPEVAVHLFDWTGTQQNEALLQGTLDAGFLGFAEDATSSLARQSVGKCALHAVLPQSHPLARKRQLRLAALAGEPFLVISQRNYPGASRLALEACEQAGFRPRILQTAERGHALLGLVASGCGVALLPEPLGSLPHAGVAFRPLADQPEAELVVAWNPSRSHPARDQFLNTLPEVSHR